MHMCDSHCLFWCQSQVLLGTFAPSHVTAFPSRPKDYLGSHIFLRKVTSACIHSLGSPDFTVAGTGSEQCLTAHLNATQVPAKWNHSRNGEVGQAFLAMAKGILHRRGFSLCRFLGRDSRTVKSEGHSLSRWITSYLENPDPRLDGWQASWLHLV